MMYLVSNPTHRGKAVRSAGGLLTVAAGTSVSIDGDWTSELVAQYRAAGLEVAPAGAGEATPDPDPSGDPGTTPASSRDDRLSVLRDAVATFPEGEPEYWMRDGRPQVSAINDALPSGHAAYTAAERDELWPMV